MTLVEQISHLLTQCSESQRREIFQLLRRKFPIHPLERQWNTDAKMILEAIARSSDLTQRGVRGVIAEAAFKYWVIAKLRGWSAEEFAGDQPYDFLLRDAAGSTRIQVKMQRLKGHAPMKASQAYRRLPDGMFVVETQKTRGGRGPHTGEDTRPYRFNEFDILAVSMHPSTNDWRSFMYAVSDWLLERPQNPKFMLKFQPVPKSPNEGWTDDFLIAVRWLRSGEKRKIPA